MTSVGTSLSTSRRGRELSPSSTAEAEAGAEAQPVQAEAEAQLARWRAEFEDSEGIDDFWAALRCHGLIRLVKGAMEDGRMAKIGVTTCRQLASITDADLDILCPPLPNGSRGGMHMNMRMFMHEWKRRVETLAAE